MSSDVQEIEQAIQALPRPEVERLREWIENYLGDQLEDPTNLRRGAQFTVIADCRKIFSPLTEIITCPPSANALHVTKTSWQNDDLLPTEALKKKGLQIWFDVLPDELSLVGGGQPSASPMVIVSVEASIPSGTAAPDSTFILDTKITLQSDSILLQIEDPKIFDELIQQQALVRVRVTLKGHTIFSQPGADIVYLDGQAFGKAGIRADSKTPRIDLNLPSGGGGRASDFESWFYIASSKNDPIGTDTGGATTEMALTAAPKPAAKRKTATQKKSA